jgi:hypothetical protein
LLFVGLVVVTVPLGRAAVGRRMLPVVSRPLPVTLSKSSIAAGGDPTVVQRVQLVPQGGDHAKRAFEQARHLDVSKGGLRRVATAEPFEGRVERGRQISQLAAQRASAIDRLVVPTTCLPVSQIGGIVPQTGGGVADRCSLITTVCGPTAACSRHWLLAHGARPFDCGSRASGRCTSSLDVAPGTGQQ